MARETQRESGWGGGDRGSSRVGALSKSVRSRRAAFADSGSGVFLARVIDALTAPSLGAGLLVAVLFTVCCTALAIWARQQPLVAVGRVMDETHLVRRTVTLDDPEATRQMREGAKASTPRVYQGDTAVLDGLAQSIENLPRALAGVTKVEDVDPKLRDAFGITAETLALLQGQVVEGEPSLGWRESSRNLANFLARRPLLDAQTYQKAVTEGSHTTIRLLVGKDLSADALRTEVLNVEDKPLLTAAMTVMARDAGFTGALQQLIVQRLVHDNRPTFAFDPTLTAEEQEKRVKGVDLITRTSPAGQVIFDRGDVLSTAQAELYAEEVRLYHAGLAPWERFTRWGGLAMACGAITAAIAGYITLFSVRARQHSGRLMGIGLVLGSALAMACVATVMNPAFAAVTTTAPTLLVATLMAIVYDRRMALALGLLHGVLVCVALHENVATLAVMVAGIGGIVWNLKGVRERTTLLKTSLAAAFAVGGATIVFSLVERPLTLEVLTEIGWDTGYAALGAMVVGGLTLFLLPVIEKTFGVTTGLTLTDLRDPKQPLLRELQLRAPGTYTHSLNVASIAEAAAESIGADGLLTYVGALYHDVGKMNKPEYFVENQMGGANKHDKLSPAMSLLIVVGHVKDGVELAREFKLPGAIQHFIEAHHGTTLVEYFYHRAKKIAEAVNAGLGEDEEPGDEQMVPDEFEYRYPGPKPRTREVAILMLSDAVESATRAMSDPTPARIDTLVREIAHKRLMDGQFDDCELTLRDLNTIVESVIRTLTSMHHSRVSYPGSGTGGAQAKRA